MIGGPVILMLIGALIATESYAKSGCSNFGHSCYGGIGKRGDLDSPTEEIAQNPVQETENPTYVFPGGRGTSGIFRPLRYNNRLTPEQSEQVNRYVREWIINYLRREDEIEQN